MLEPTPTFPSLSTPLSSSRRSDHGCREPGPSHEPRRRDQALRRRRPLAVSEVSVTKASHVAGAVPSAPPAVLVVNDRENQRVAIRSMLAPLDVVIVEVDSGRAALRAVFDRMFAVVLMDVQMPEIDGYETADLIRQRPRSSKTPIIFVTAHASDEIGARAAYATGAVDFLFTPVVPDVLRAKVSVF